MHKDIILLCFEKTLLLPVQEIEILHSCNLTPLSCNYVNLLNKLVNGVFVRL